MAKINITMPDELLTALDEYADKACMSRSGFVAQSLRTYIDSLKFSNMLDELTLAIKRIGVTGNDDTETVAEVNRMLTCLSVLSQKQQ